MELFHSELVFSICCNIVVLTNSDSITEHVVIGTYRWGNVEFPLPFGRTMSAAEEKIHRMDEKVSRALCQSE